MEFLLIVLTLLVIPFIVSFITNIVTGLFFDSVNRPGFRILIFKAILLILPKSYRNRYGEEMMLVFMETCEEAAEQYGMIGVFFVVTHELADVTKSAVFIRGEFIYRKVQAIMIPIVLVLGAIFSFPKSESIQDSEVQSETPIMDTLTAASLIEAYAREGLEFGSINEVFAQIRWQNQVLKHIDWTAEVKSVLETRNSIVHLLNELDEIRRRSLN